MSRIAISSKRVLLPGRMESATVIINDGTIEDIVGEFSAADIPHEDVGNHVLMPGIVDPHVHINEPGRTDWEGFDTATRAAIAGGITSLVEMPLNASPVTTSVKAFEEKISASFDTPGTTSKLHCHCGFWGGVLPGNEQEIEPLIEKGVLGFKAFLVDSGIDEFPPVTATDLRKVMPVIAKHKLPLLVHCELSKPLQHPSSTTHYADYLASRPRSWEDDAIALMIRLCEEFNCRTHIVHLSSSDSIAQIKQAKERGLPLTVETAQHYLYFNAETIPDGRTDFKCAPPIREESNKEKLWMALKDGTIDFVATDHSPAPPSMKQLHTGDFMKAWGGIASLQFALPVLWTAAKKEGCNPWDICQWLSERPVLLPRLKTKGRIAKGFDADLVVWDPDKKFTVTKEMIQHRHKITPYLDETLYGIVKQTWLGGQKLFDDGKFLHLNKGKIIYHE